MRDRDFFRTSVGQWSLDETRASRQHDNDQRGKQVFGRPQAGVSFVLRWLDQLEQRVGDTDQRHVSDDLARRARLTLAQPKVLFTIAEEDFNRPDQRQLKFPAH
jgi:hypothetical protein